MREGEMTKQKVLGNHPVWSSAGIGAALVAVSMGMHTGAAKTVLGVTGACLLIVVPLLAFCWGYYRCFRENMDIVSQGIPSPQEIRQQFVQTQGREPTVAEVADLHQMATSRRNQAMLNTGILFGGAVLANRTAHGKPLL